MIEKKKLHPNLSTKASKLNNEVQMKCFFLAEFERAAKIRKIAVYRFLISLLDPEYNGLKISSFRSKVVRNSFEMNQNQ